MLFALCPPPSLKLRWTSVPCALSPPPSLKLRWTSVPFSGHLNQDPLDDVGDILLFIDTSFHQLKDLVVLKKL